MSRGKSFSKEELDFIKVHSLDMSVGGIANALGRNYWSIQRIMQKSFSVKKNHTYTPDEDFMIRQMYKTHSIRLIATKLGVDETSVYNRAKLLGINKNNMSKTSSEEELKK